jgi:hypothetical protein
MSRDANANTKRRRFFDRHAVLGQMHAMRTGSERDVDAIIDPRLDARLHHRAREVQELATVEILLANLHGHGSRRCDRKDLVDARGNVRAQASIRNENDAHYSIRPTAGELAFA